MNESVQHTHPRSTVVKAIALTITLGLAMSFSASAYELIDLGVDVTPTDINNFGTVVGSRLDGTTRIAIRYTTSIGLQDLVGGSVANGVNDNELITGNTLTGAFLYDDRLRDIGDDYTGGAINELGQIAGSKAGTNPYRATPRPVNPAIYDPSANGQKWQVLDVANVYPRGTRQGVYADLYYLMGINDAGYAVGRKSRYGLAGSAPFLSTPEFKAVAFLPIPNGGSATAINNFNRVVGVTGNDPATSGSHAFLYDYDRGTYIDLGTLNGGLRSNAADINDADQVVGSAWLSTVNTSLSDPSLYRAFVWDTVNGMVALNELVDAPDWILTAATAINQQGDIVGTGIMGGQMHGFLLSNDTPPPPGPNQPPTAMASADVTSGKAPLTVHFSSTGSSDPDGDIQGYAWDFGDGTTTIDLNPSHTYTEPGTYLAILTVTDSDSLTDTAQVTIKVRKGGRTK